MIVSKLKNSIWATGNLVWSRILTEVIEYHLIFGHHQATTRHPKLEQRAGGTFLQDIRQFAMQNDILFDLGLRREKSTNEHISYLHIPY